MEAIAVETPKPIEPALTSYINGSQALMRCLVAEGVDTIFGYPGRAVLPIYDALFEDERLRHVRVRHEPSSCSRS